VVHVAADLVRDGGAHRPVLPADLDAGQVEQVEHQLDLAADQGGVDFVAVAVQGHGRGLCNGAVFGPQERLVQLRRVGQDRRVAS
jgi:hypothetical protein